MKRTEQSGTAVQPVAPKHPKSSSGNGDLGFAEITKADLGAILAGLQTMRDGDFSVRLAGDWTGGGGKIADTFNELVIANQRMAQVLSILRHDVGKDGNT